MIAEISTTEVGMGTCDVLEDIFYVKLLDAKAEFVLEMANNMEFHPRIFSPLPLKVMLGEGETKVESLFRNQLQIVDPAGYKYLFGKEDHSREMTNLVNVNLSITAWKVSEITSPDGERIQFSYLTTLPVEVHNDTYDYYATEANYPSGEGRDPTPPPHPGFWKGVDNQENYYFIEGAIRQPDLTYKPIHSQWTTVTNRRYTESISRIDVRPISKITFEGGSVSFIYHPTDRTLESIQIKDNSTVLRTITLVKNMIPSDGRRLLEEVRIADSGNQLVQKYNMEYYHTGSYPNRTKAVDYWGYYNGSIGNTDLVPRQKVNLTVSGQPVQLEIGGANKEGDAYSARSYSLQKIKYPSGGTTTYSYDLSKIYTPDSPKGFLWGGNLRIQSIVEVPMIGHPIERSFSYVNGPDHSEMGSMRFPLCNKSFHQQLDKYYVSTPQISTTRRVDYDLYSHVNLVTPDLNVYYDTVQESIVSFTGTSQLPEKTVTIHYFNNYQHWDSFYYTNQSYIESIDEPVNNQQLLSCERQSDLQKNNSPIQSNLSQTDYAYYDIAHLKKRSLIAGVTSTELPSMDAPVKELFRNSYEFTNRKHFTALDPFPTGKGSTTYYLANRLTESEHLLRRIPEKNNADRDKNQRNSKYNQIRQVVKQTSNGYDERIEYTYPFDLSGSVYSQMIAANEVSTPIETRFYSGDQLLKTIKHNYTINNTRRGYSLSSISESTDASATQLRTVETYSRPLLCGRPTQVTSLDGTITSFLWAYGGRHVIAIARNLPVSVFESKGIQLENLANSHSIPASTYTVIEELRAQYPKAQITTYRYRPLVGLIQQTDPNGVSSHYTYDSMGRLLEMKDNQSKNISTFEYHEANQ